MGVKLGYKIVGIKKKRAGFPAPPQVSCGAQGRLRGAGGPRSSLKMVPGKFGGRLEKKFKAIVATLTE